MGMYVNPKDETQDEFLEREGKMVESVKWDDVPSGELPVVLIDNGPWKAAGVAYKSSELDAFTDPNDHRNRVIFLVPIDKLIPTVDEDDALVLTKISEAIPA